MGAIGKYMLDATVTYYGEGHFFYNKWIKVNSWNENVDQYDVTIQIVTYEEPVNPPYGIDTIFLKSHFRIHKIGSDIERILLEKH